MIAAPASAAVTVHFDGKRVPAFSLGGQWWRALVGTDPETPVGAHSVTVTRWRSATVLRSALSVHLRPGHFGVRHLTLPARTFGLITPRNLELERRALDPVLSRLTPRALWRGPFLVPAPGPIDSPYGDQGIYNGHREWWHQGVDIDAPEGTPVAAANTGIVALARLLPLGGLTVLLDHGQGVVTEYLHLRAVTVREGQRVSRGTVIGRIGATGLVTGPSLHWALFVRGVPVNPLFWISVRPGLTGGLEASDLSGPGRR